MRIPACVGLEDDKAELPSQSRILNVASSLRLIYVGSLAGHGALQRLNWPHFQSELQYRPFPQRGQGPAGMNGRKAGFPALGHRRSGR